MAFISVFDMLKIGVGPSSSHTLGPWRAAERFLEELIALGALKKTASVRVDLFGSLSLTGRGHSTDLAVLLGLSGEDPERIEVEKIDSIIASIRRDRALRLGGRHLIRFSIDDDVVFYEDFLPFHPNGLTFTAFFDDKSRDRHVSTYYSIGGGFIVKEGAVEEAEAPQKSPFPFPIEHAEQLLGYCAEHGKQISEIVFENEKALRSPEKIEAELDRIWQTMLECLYIGCHTEGILPGGLGVRRRAAGIHKRLMGELIFEKPTDWLRAVRQSSVAFRDIFKWVSCFALAVNEVNASLGRVVTAPTNGSAGVIPAVLMYFLAIENREADARQVRQFLLVAGEIGSIFKKGATISAAMGGCQAEIGVSSAMAAAALCELLGGSPERCIVAAEIAMEHHLGMTCDPIDGLVQIPCIERNAMGAMKAINAAVLALETDPKDAKVPLDKVIATMWETAKDMSAKYKETSKGGLAVAIADC